MPDIRFTVDAALFRELGERLVGKPHIALGELVKNSYDADATLIVIKFASEADDWIEIVDNGSGMDFAAFRDFWMRVGSPHKERAATSAKLGRPLTGSKGIGRLSVQFLARSIEMVTRPESDPNVQIRATVDWSAAVRAGDLTQATAVYELEPATQTFADGSDHGTLLRLGHLNQKWTAPLFEDLAKEIWPLQPPFDTQQADAGLGSFRVRLDGPNPEVVARFDRQMTAILDLWHARIVGRLSQDEAGEQRVDLGVVFDDGSRRAITYPVGPSFASLSFEIRVFTLTGRQPQGIRVEEARDYLNRFGGVHVYDAGFHMPYYGPETDWLRVEFDHSHRLSRSQLLPNELQVSDGLNYLPTNSRLYGVVRVDTGAERGRFIETGGQGSGPLTLQISRDRLVDNDAYRALQSAVRWALDYYAMQEAAREFRRAEATRDVEPISEKAGRVEDVLDRYEKQMPAEVHRQLSSEIRGVVTAAEGRSELLERQTGLLGALATAGISALALEHETKKQLHALGEMVDELSRNDPAATSAAVDRMRGWIERVRGMRRLFEPLLDAETAATTARMSAKTIVSDVVDALHLLVRDVTYETDNLDSQLLLPSGTFAEWFALFQNVFVNAANALVDSEEKVVAISSHRSSDRVSILIQDKGVGVDLGSAEDLFQPFVRRLEISPERRYLGLGGSGLGLTIVRMIASNRGCRVGFVAPERGYTTALRLGWREL